MRSKLKRYLLLLHRWFGIGMCVLIALWFATGIVMMYVEYPELTEQERLAMLPPIPLQHVHIDAAAAAATLESAAELSAVRLTTVLGRPAYQLTQADGRLHTVFADDGAELQGLATGDAETAARHSGFAADAAAPRHVATLEMDQWTVSAALSPYRPLHKVAIGDVAGTFVYVSDISGQIVRDTTRNERFWNWLGSTIHWLYPWQLRRNTELWSNIIIVLCLAGLVCVFSGAVVGWWRLRLKKPYRRGVTPYRGMHKWHHLLGLASLLFLFTFIFSGLMSMAPWNLFANATSAVPAIERYTGGGIGNLAEYPRLGAAASPGTVKEVEWARLNGQPYLVLADGDNRRAVIGSAGKLSAAEVRARMEAAIPALLPDAALVHVAAIRQFDDYYYSHHNRYRPLPVLRVQFADPERSWFHLDLETGQVLNRLTHTDRVARWLYNGLHSLDFAVLFQRRPLWDVVVILLCAIGLVFSTTSLWIGWRRLRH